MSVAEYDIRVVVRWGEGQGVVLWTRVEPAWHLASPCDCDEYAGATEVVDDWRPNWRFRTGKTMRRAGFRHQ